VSVAVVHVAVTEKIAKLTRNSRKIKYGHDFEFLEIECLRCGVLFCFVSPPPYSATIL
jgi:hypothetical protein